MYTLRWHKRNQLSLWVTVSQTSHGSSVHCKDVLVVRFKCSGQGAVTSVRRATFFSSHLGCGSLGCGIRLTLFVYWRSCCQRKLSSATIPFIFLFRFDMKANNELGRSRSRCFQFLLRFWFFFSWGFYYVLFGLWFLRVFLPLAYSFLVVFRSGPPHSGPFVLQTTQDALSVSGVNLLRRMRKKNVLKLGFLEGQCTCKVVCKLRQTAES